jgi:hypothetical protein
MHLEDASGKLGVNDSVNQSRHACLRAYPQIAIAIVGMIREAPPQGAACICG